MTRRIFGVPVRVSPAMPMTLALLCMLSGGEQAIALFVSLAAHEGFHALAARAVGIAILEIELMPFGGAARVENVWAMRPGQLIIVTLSGPLGSLLLGALSLLLGRAGAISADDCARWTLCNAGLFLINMMPALPLDGGRLLCGIVGLKWGQQRAARLGIWAGRALAGALIALSIAAYMSAGKINLTFPLCAAFLLAAGGREKMAAGSATLFSLLDRQTELHSEGALPVRWLAAAEDARVGELLKKMRPRAVHRVAVYDRAFKLKSVLEEGALLSAALHDLSAPVGSLSGSTHELQLCELRGGLEGP